METCLDERDGMIQTAEGQEGHPSDNVQRATCNGQRAAKLDLSPNPLRLVQVSVSERAEGA
jgi:hypothetical protein